MSRWNKCRPKHLRSESCPGPARRRRLGVVLREIRQALETFPTFDEMTVEESEFESQVSTLLAGKVFHTTGAHLLPKIVESRGILPIADGKFRSPFEKSRISYGVQRDYVCLFDFRIHNSDVIKSAFECFLSGAVEKYAHRPAFLVLGQALHSNLIDLGRRSAKPAGENYGFRIWNVGIQRQSQRTQSLESFTCASGQDHSTDQYRLGTRER